MAAELVAGNGKAALRFSVKRILKSLSEDYIHTSSCNCIQRLSSIPEFEKSHVVCTYMAMPSEIQTVGLIDACFESNKSVCIPKILGKESGDMIMIELSSNDELTTLPKNSWGIPEHSLEMIHGNNITDFSLQGTIDFIIIPGVAFDETGNRLGHGKGYYGKQSNCTTHHPTLQLQSSPTHCLL